MSKETTPKIYVASLSDYNSGILFGIWVDLEDKDFQEVMEEIQSMLKESPTAKKYGTPAEEWAVHDAEGFYHYPVHEYEDIEELVKLAGQINEHGEAFTALMSNGFSFEEAEESFEEVFMGEHSSELEYATQLFDEIFLHQIPEGLQGHIDYESFSRDIFIGDHFSVESHNHTVFVFRNI